MEHISKLEQRIGPVGMVAFSDDNLMVDEKRGLSIIETLYQRGILVDYINIRIDQLKDHLIEAFARFEVHSIFFGFESGNRRLLRLVNKNISPDQILDRVKALQRFPQITVTASGIIGLPTETEEEVKQDIAFALDVHRLIRNGMVSLFCFMPLPATRLTDLAVENGFRLPTKTADWRIIDPQYEGYQMDWLPWMTPKKKKGIYLSQTLIRNFMPKVPEASVVRNGYLKIFSVTNRWRLRHQFFSGLAIQQQLERGIRRVGAYLLSLRKRSSRSAIRRKIASSEYR